MADHRDATPNYLFRLHLIVKSKQVDLQYIQWLLAMSDTQFTLTEFNIVKARYTSVTAAPDIPQEPHDVVVRSEDAVELLKALLKVRTELISDVKAVEDALYFRAKCYAVDHGLVWDERAE